MGKRENNRKKRHAAMLSVAADMLANKGINGIRLKDVAIQAGVSPATLYNYFPTKGHLIVEFFRADIEIIQAAQFKMIEDPPEDPIEAILKVIHGEYEAGHILGDRMVWREVYSTAIAFTDETVDFVNPLRKERTKPYRKLLKKLKSLGRLSPDADTGSLAEVICCLNETYFLSCLLGEDFEIKVKYDRIRRNLETVFAQYIT